MSSFLQRRLKERKMSVDSIAEEFKDSIKRGEYGASGRLPSITQLSEEHQVSRTTAYQIMTVLQNAGLVVKRGSSFYANYIMRISTSVVPPFEEVLSEQEVSPPKNIVEPEIIVMPDNIA